MSAPPASAGPDRLQRRARLPAAASDSGGSCPPRLLSRGVARAALQASPHGLAFFCQPRQILLAAADISAGPFFRPTPSPARPGRPNFPSAELAFRVGAGHPRPLAAKAADLNVGGPLPSRTAFSASGQRPPAPPYRPRSAPSPHPERRVEQTARMPSNSHPFLGIGCRPPTASQHPQPAARPPRPTPPIPGRSGESVVAAAKHPRALQGRLKEPGRCCFARRRLPVALCSSPGSQTPTPRRALRAVAVQLCSTSRDRPSVSGRSQGARCPGLSVGPTTSTPHEFFRVVGP